MISKQIEKALFEAARELGDPGVRAAFLEQACNGNAGLRGRLEQLLAVEMPAEDFFSVNPVHAAGVAAVAEGVAAGEPPLPPGDPLLATSETVIGRYRLLQRLGEGGCGVVYLAEQQEPVRRRVALKIIRLGMDTERVISRFEAERQALALMDHPNIAHVLDAGATESGRPYFVMELVQGVKITDYCNQHQLDTRQRIELCIQVCHAIQHAHQKGVIHRDIKPSNILVTLHDGSPMPKVIDFGIAKATEGRLADNTFSTGCDQFIGTPAYMSPEQANYGGLDVDTRSDIYSLGVVLYEMLAGRTPFDSKHLVESGVDEMRRTLLEREPQPPSTLLTTLGRSELTRIADQHHAEPLRLISALQGDLDWIVMKALEKDRRRRYETANGLAMDLQRYLNNEPVVARPPSRWYRLQKLAQRNRGTFAAIVAVAVALFIGLGVSTWLFLKEREARQWAVSAEKQQIRLREEADRLRLQAEYRQKLTQATVLLSRDCVEAADRLVADIPTPEPNLEYADLFRTLGDWHSVHGRWKPAADRFGVLLQVNQPDDRDITTLDYLRYGPLLLELGDRRGYEHFRETALNHFLSTTNPLPAERVVKVSLLTPADPPMLAALRPLAEIASNSLAGGMGVDASLAAWRSFSLALMDYRRGDFAGAIHWGERSQAYQTNNVSRSANLGLVLAMAHYHVGQRAQAEAELAQAREQIEKRFSQGLEIGAGGEGFWFDWVYAQVIMREAIELIGEPPFWDASGEHETR
jgi:hypothetical protein